jgi:hypothetical protein
MEPPPLRPSASRHILRAAGAVAVVFAAVTGTFGVSSASSATPITYYVGSTADNLVASQSACESSTNTTCTLRAAIAFANTDGAAYSDTISLAKLPLATTITVSSTTGPLTISDAGAVTIVGRGPTTVLSGAGLTQVLKVTSAASAVTISQLSVDNGAATGSLGGGGLYNAGTTTLNNVTFSTNWSGAHGGGAIENQGTLHVSGGTISANSTTGCGGGVLAQPLFATQVSFNATITLLDGVTVADNASDCGGGVADLGGPTTITSSTITGNVSRDYDDGGGVWADPFTRGGPIWTTLTMNNDTVAYNVSFEFGGGVAVGDSVSSALTNDTIVANHALQGGGGFANTASNGTQTLTGVVFSSNTESSGTHEISNQCLNYHALVSGGYNVVARATDVGCLFSSVGDVSVSSVGLGALSSNGGRTQTMAPSATSPVVGIEPASLCPATDQRGAARPSAGAGAPCDAGAVELATTAPTVTCKMLKGSISSVATFLGCTPNSRNKTASVTTNAASLIATASPYSSVTSLTWHTAAKRTTVAVGSTVVTPSVCPGGSIEYAVNGLVTASALPGAPVLSRVAFRACVATSTGAISLLAGTTAHL